MHSEGYSTWGLLVFLSVRLSVGYKIFNKVSMKSCDTWNAKKSLKLCTFCIIGKRERANLVIAMGRFSLSGDATHTVMLYVLMGSPNSKLPHTSVNLACPRHTVGPFTTAELAVGSLSLLKQPRTTIHSSQETASSSLRLETRPSRQHRMHKKYASSSMWLFPVHAHQQLHTSSWIAPARQVRLAFN